jgi:hypothetical protein
MVMVSFLKWRDFNLLLNLSLFYYVIKNTVRTMFIILNKTLL